jgi:RNA polymerase sigma-70 factor, ECF subfamily
MGPIAAETNGRSHDTEALYRAHGAAVARLCRSLLRDRGEAEDATQQVFLSAHSALLNGAAPREPRAWLLAVARHECYARFRQRAVAPVSAAEPTEGATADASVQALRADELATLWAEVGRMPHTQREAFLLREILGLSYGQLADHLSLSPPSVRSLLLRARARLRQRLGDVVTGLGGAPWVQALFRLAGGGDGASPLPGAAKAAAVGVGALALAGGGSLVAHHAPKAPGHTGGRHKAHAPERQVVAPAAGAVAPSEHGSGAERSHRDGGSPRPGSRRSVSRDGGGKASTSSGDSSSGSGRSGSDDTTTVTRSTMDGRDGDVSSSSGPGSGGSTNVSLSTSGRDGSGSDGGPDSTTTGTTTTTSSGSDGSGGSDGGSTDTTDGHGG